MNDKTIEFIKKAKLKHIDSEGNQKYSYDRVDYITSKIKVKITCSKHGDFEQVPYSHLKGANCPKCTGRLKNNNEVLKHLREVHSNKYNYDKTVYKNSATKLIINCLEHGDFKQLYSDHLSGKGCPKCADLGKGSYHKKSNKSFIKESRKIHKDKYNYSKVIYKNIHTPIIIICKDHGEFEQTPSKHLLGRGCQTCGGTGKSNKIIFIDKANIKHNNKYNYDKVNYIKSNIKVIINCPEHGDFEQAPSSHMIGRGCPNCGVNNLKLTSEDFIHRASIIHKDKYEYDKVVYKNSYTRVIIKCLDHNDFLQSPHSHLEGKGCPKCAKELRGWTRTDFKNQCDKNNKGLGILYVIRCFNESESFYKIGITSISIKSRYKSNMPYDYEVIHEVHKEPELVYNLEHRLLRELAEHSYKPLIPFAGQTECISNLSLIEEQLKIA